MAVGPGPVDLTLAPEDPVITAVDVADDGGVGVADPFLLRTDDGWLMFYEVIRLDERGPNGERAVIGVAGSDDAIDWQHWGIVLEEPFHLSYPGVFEDDGTWYMVPESGEAGRVILYEATAFPMEWAESKTLLEGVYRDPTVFAHGGTWWMFATDSGDVDDDTLRLFMAPELNGSWTEHPASPVVDGDVSRARSAGGVVIVDRELVRFAQDNTDGYGKAVEGHVITTLTTTVTPRSSWSNPSWRQQGRGGRHRVCTTSRRSRRSTVDRA